MLLPVDNGRIPGTEISTHPCYGELTLDSVA
jgi:hypothetical protein